MKYYTIDKRDKTTKSGRTYYRADEYRSLKSLKAALFSAAKHGHELFAARELELKVSFDDESSTKNEEGHYFLVYRTQKYSSGGYSDDGGYYYEYTAEEFGGTRSLLESMYSGVFCSEAIPAQGLEYKIELLLGETKLGGN